ncbi:unnamed protein product [Withania somnifera]
MSWDADLAAKAKNYANSRIGDCNLIHSGPGENLAKGDGDFTGRRAVELWVAEKPNYDYAANKCVGGQCCGRARCNNGWWFVCCNYAPLCNIIGRRPY